MANAASSDFSRGNVKSHILRLAMPMMLAQLINVLYNMVDRVYIGHIPEASTDALTGVGLVFPIITVISAFSYLFGQGGAPLFSIARGEGDVERARRIMGNSFALLMASGLLLAALCYVFRRPILYIFGASDVTYPYAASYMSIYLIGTLFVMISLGMNPYINAQGFGVIGMLTVSIGAAMNIVLDPIFIFAFGLGVSGAAIATVLSQSVSALWVLRFLTGKKAIITLQPAYMRVNPKLAKEIAALGLAGFITQMTNGAVQIVCNATLQRWGGDLYVGIMTVLNSVREIINLPVQGLSSGAQPVISFNYGAKEYARVRAAIKFMALVGVAFTVAAWGLLMVFPSFFIRIFNDDATLLAQGVPAIRLYFFGICAMAMMFAGQSTFTALGKARYAITFSVLRKVIIVIPLTLLLPMVAGLGANGVFLAEPVSDVVGGTACFSTMLLTVWQGLKNNEDAAKE